MRSRPTTTQALFASALATVVALLCRLALEPLIGERVPFITFLPAAFVVAWWGGFRPTAIFAALSLPVLMYFVLQPKHSLAVELGEFRAGLVMYVAIVLATGWLGQQLHAAQRRLEKARQQAIDDRERLRVTLTSIGDGVIVTDARLRIVSLNTVAEQLTGWRNVSGVHRQIDEVFQIINEETRAPVDNPCAQVLETGAVVGLANHTLLVARDGTERPIDDSAAPIKTASGELLGVVLVFRDVSEKRAAAKALARSERELADFFDNAAIGLHWVGPDGVIMRANRADYELLGYSQDNYVGRPLAEFYADEREIQDIFSRLQAGETVENREATLRHRDGSLRHVLVTSNVYREDGEFVHTRCFTRDITARKRAQEGLSFLVDATTSLAAIVDHRSALEQAARLTIPYLADFTVLTLLGPDRQIEFQAHAHRDPAQEERLKSLLSRFPLNWESPSIVVSALASGRPQFVAELAPAALGKLVGSKEHLNAALELQPRSAIAVPLMIRDRVIGALSLVMAESQRTYDEQDLQLAEEFARRVATALDNAQLFQSLQETNRQKDEFLAMLAHELRNPLAAIRYAVTLGQMSTDDASEVYEIVERQVDNLAHLVDDLLDVSRVSRDKIKLVREYLDARTIIQRAAAAAKAFIDEKQHTLQLDIKPGLLPLWVDPTRAEQIIGNLLVNAAKFTPPEGRIVVRAWAENQQVVIQVIDNGAGLPPEMLSRVFELFAQGDRSLDRSAGGLGIGLTVARRLAEMHGGSLSAASAGLGLGAEFTLRLPLIEAPSDAAAQGTHSSGHPLPPQKILVVDDNRDTARTSAMLLRAAGHEVEEAHDGPTALEVARRFHPQSILLDIGLPGLNGYEVCRTLRREGFDQTLIIAISGYGQPEDRHRSREAGFDQHLVKPVNHQVLLDLLRVGRLAPGVGS
ncbi:MAG: PAS domain S-box protein [Pirellulales bacterium]